MSHRVCILVALAVTLFDGVAAFSQKVSPPPTLSPEQRQAWEKVINDRMNITMLKAKGGGLLAYFYCPSPCDDAGLALLAKIPDVTEISINEADAITARGIANFARMPRLRKLRLSEMKKLNEEDLAELKRCEALEDLHLLHVCRLTDKGVKHLIGVPKLHRLDIHGASLTAESVEHFKRMKSLKQLKITYSGLTPEVIARLRRLPGVEVEIGTVQR